MMFKHWQRHTASVPKGLLRNTVLRMLSQRQMSGSEIMAAIEEETNGRWRPSPGSVYPLLAWLTDNNFIKGVPGSEEGIKRYTLTEKGRKFLEEAKKKKIDFGEPRFMIPPMMGWSNFYPPTKEDVKLRRALGKLFKSLVDIRMNMCDEISKKNLEEVSKIIDEASEKIEKIIKGELGESRDAKAKEN
ncbi:MAG: PadR family transcriptional regulator [Nitrososphaeria archaeon]